jgi:hypothetical protein
VPEPTVWTFFYGSYINMEVLREVNYAPEKWEAARLAGFDVCIRPRANLVRSNQHSVYGILATGTHAELDRLYARAKDVLGEIYLPEAVLAETLDGKWRPASRKSFIPIYPNNLPTVPKPSRGSRTAPLVFSDLPASQGAITCLLNRCTG